MIHRVALATLPWLLVMPAWLAAAECGASRMPLVAPDPRPASTPTLRLPIEAPAPRTLLTARLGSVAEAVLAVRTVLDRCAAHALLSPFATAGTDGEGGEASGDADGEGEFPEDEIVETFLLENRAHFEWLLWLGREEAMVQVVLIAEGIDVNELVRESTDDYDEDPLVWPEARALTNEEAPSHTETLDSVFICNETCAWGGASWPTCLGDNSLDLDDAAREPGGEAERGALVASDYDDIRLRTGDEEMVPWHCPHGTKHVILVVDGVRHIATTTWYSQWLRIEGPYRLLFRPAIQVPMGYLRWLAEEELRLPSWDDVVREFDDSRTGWEQRERRYWLSDDGP